MPTLPPFRMMFNNDSTNIGGCVSPWRLKGETFDDARIAASIEEAAAAGADCHVLAPGLGWIPWWKSTVYPDHYQRWMARTGLPPDQYGQYMLGGGDVLACHVATCRRLGIACMASLRMNDVHMMEHHSPDNELSKKLSIWVSSFYCEHLDCLIDPKHHEVKGYYGRRGLDWGRQEVRDYKLALIREMVAYDIDGIELDCLRDDHLFADHVPVPRRIELLAGFCRSVRALLDAASRERGKPLWLSVRIPHDPVRHAESGIDAAAFQAAGVSIFNCSGWYDTTQRTEGIAHVRAQAPESAVFAELTHSAGYHPYFLPSSRYGTSGNPRCSDQQLYTTARQALQAGAHGISLFNFVYYRQIEGVEAKDAICCEPPFHTLRRLVDLPWLERQPGHYHLSGNSYFRQVPRKLAGGETTTFQFELLQHPLAFEARLRIHALERIPEGAEFQARFNGQPVAATAEHHRHFGNPFDPLVSPAGHRRSFTIPVALLRIGLNDVELLLKSPHGIELVYLDLGVDTKAAAAALQDWSKA